MTDYAPDDIHLTVDDIVEANPDEGEVTFEGRTIEHALEEPPRTGEFLRFDDKRYVVVSVTHHIDSPEPWVSVSCLPAWCAKPGYFPPV